MQQYFYGDIGGKGYAFASSFPKTEGKQSFFEKNGSRMTPLINYDAGSRHGDLATAAHQCFWMLATNLEDVAEPERLYLQVSGVISRRTAVYTQGYVSDIDEQVFGSRLMELLDTAFCRPEEAEGRLAELGEKTLTPVPIEQMPRMYLEPAALAEDRLRAILYAVLNNQSVIIRLASTGAQAMREARQVLLAIYQRLPWERRRTFGCVTGVSRAMLSSEKNPLPGGVRILLMDGDADTAGLAASPYRPYVDLAGEQPCPQVPRKNGNRELPYTPLLDFLTQAAPAELENFFAFCQKTLQKEPNGRNPELSQYCMAFDMYSMERLDFGTEALYNWAVSLYDNSWTPRMRETLYVQIAGKLTPGTMERYLLGFAETYEDLFRLGVLEKDDMNHSKTAKRDRNAALTLRLVGFLKKLYPQDLEEHLAQTLGRRFVELACQTYPELTERHPTAETLEKLKALPMPEDKASAAAVVKPTRDYTARQLKRGSEDVAARYRYNLEHQRELGLGQIQAWFLAGTDEGLETLYARLEEHYLYRELLPEPQGWNRVIAQGLAEFCGNNSHPGSLDQCRRLLKKVQSDRKQFAAHQGSLTPEENAQVDKTLAQWQNAIDLSQRACENLAQLLALFDEIDAQGFATALSDSLKSQAAANRMQHGVTWAMLRECGGLLEKRKLSEPERDCLRELVAACPDMRELPEGLSAEQVSQRLTCCAALADLGLHEGTVAFPQWAVTDSAKVLSGKLESLRGYRTGQPEPVWDTWEEKTWAARMLGSNTDLMTLLAVRERRLRRDILPRLAKSDRITAEQIQSLYRAGCTKRQLRAGAGEETGAAWKFALDRAFPAWPELGNPLGSIDRGGSVPFGLAAAHGILVGVGALVPAAAMLLTGAASQGSGLIAAGALAALAVGCLIGGALAKRSVLKKYLTITGLAAVPGLLAAIGILAMTVLK